DAAEIGVRLAEDLHGDAGTVFVFAQQLARAHEVFVGVIAFPHLVDGEVKDFGVEAFPSCHQRAPGQAKVAANVSPVGSASWRATLLRWPQTVPYGCGASGGDTRRQSTSASSARARSREERGGSGRAILTTSVVARPIRTSWTTRGGSSSTRSMGRGPLTVSPRTRLRMTRAR